MNNEQTKKAYEEKVKKMTPVNPTYKNLIWAFIFGGGICTLGEAIRQYVMYLGVSEEMAGTYCSLILIAISALLTGLNLYPSIAKIAGAGILVPITGFANSICAEALEFKKEGQVFGIGAKIFTIAGPVILYGILTSWLLGVIYYVAAFIFG